jgi:hypothetical protein
MVGVLHARRGELAADHAIGLGLDQMRGQADSLLIADAL